MNWRLVNLKGWEGPSVLSVTDEVCSSCGGLGYHEDGEQVDVDDFIPALCNRCDGTGIEPEGDEE